MKSLHHQSTCIYMYIALYLIISVDLCNIIDRMYEKPASSKYMYIHVYSAISNHLLTAVNVLYVKIIFIVYIPHTTRWGIDSQPSSQFIHNTLPA